MPISIDQALHRIENASDLTTASSSIHEFMSMTKVVPLTYAQCCRVKAAASTLVSKNLVHSDHILLKLLLHRISPTFLPGVSTLHLPALPTQPSRSPSLDIHGTAESAAQDAALSSAESAGDGPVCELSSDRNGLCETGKLSQERRRNEVTSVNDNKPITAKSLESVKHSSGNGDNSASGSGFLTRPLPKGCKCQCVISRQSRFKTSTYRLYIEQHAVNLEDLQDICVRLEAQKAPLERRWIVGGQGEDMPSGLNAGQVAGDVGRLWLECERRKAKKGDVWAVRGGERVKVVGSTEGKGEGVMLLHQGEERVLAVWSGSEHDKVLGVRVALRVGMEQRRWWTCNAMDPESGKWKPLPPSMLSLLSHLRPTRTLPASKASMINTSSDTSSLNGHAETDTCLDRQMPSNSCPTCLLTHKAPRWSVSHGSHTMEFEGVGRAMEKSRRNLAVVDVREVLGQERRCGGGPWSGEKGPRMVWQMGKVGDNRFSLDFREPFSPLQAFVVAMAVFEAA